MKKIPIVLILIISTSCEIHQNEENESYADPQNKPEILYEGTQNCLNDELIYDKNPSKIPSRMDPSDSIGLLDPKDIDLADRCFPKPICNPLAEYRTINGSCNNLLFPIWGQANSANTRIIQADYSDGKSQIRKALSGNDLPNIRKIRKTLFLDLNKPTPKYNLLFMQFGQVVAHDTELIFSKVSSDGSPLKCCNPDGSTPEILPQDCLPITIPKDEPGYRKRCLTDARAADTADLGCHIKPVRQQIGVTSFIDCSLLYGSNDKIARSLRTFSYGKLRSQIGPNGESYLPNVKQATKECNVANDRTVCYAAGDLRVNQHPNIAVQTITFMRLHNKMCDGLRKINPSWDDERLYQEARKLIIGMYQHVVYNEFIPGLLGKDYAKANNLLPLVEGFNMDYDEFLNPTTITSFTGAAYRSLHSEIQGYVDLVDEYRKVKSKIRLSDFFSKTYIVQKNDNYDCFTRGLLSQISQEQDQYFTAEVSEYLFRAPNQTEGLDLVSFDIARGRDFGLPSYNRFRQLCGLSKAKTFDDFTDQITKKNVDALAKLYKDVEDVDFYVAGLLEKLKPGSSMGHTFQCISGEMFYRWKFGDRFYYEFGNQTGSFSSDQLQEIRKTSLSLILCMTSNIQSIQRNAFDVLSSYNHLVPCSNLPKLNLDPWKEF